MTEDTGRRPLPRRILSETWRQWLATGIGVLAYGVARIVSDDVVLGVLVFWNGYAVGYLAMTAVVFSRTDSAGVAARTSQHTTRGSWWRDQLAGRSGGRTLALVVSFYALLAAGWVLPRRAELMPEAPWLVGAAAVLTVVTAWLLTHVTFSQLYAAMHYGSAGARLLFPGTEQPNYWDFAYFSFGVATTFGTTDVTVQTSRMRRAVLGHAVFSFAFNTVILGLTISFLITV